MTTLHDLNGNVKTYNKPPRRIPLALVDPVNPLQPFEERDVTVKVAIQLVKGSSRIAYIAHLNNAGNVAIVDVSKATALRMLRTIKGRIKTVHVGDVFGTLTIGM